MNWNNIMTILLVYFILENSEEVIKLSCFKAHIISTLRPDKVIIFCYLIRKLVSFGYIKREWVNKKNGNKNDGTVFTTITDAHTTNIFWCNDAITYAETLTVISDYLISNLVFNSLKSNTYSTKKIYDIFIDNSTNYHY